MRIFRKRDFPVADVRRFLEPGPIVLVSSAWKGETNIMTMGWHMVMEFSPSLVGCYIWDQNHSRKLIERSQPLIRECHANFECRLHDSRMATRYNLFIWKVVKAHVAMSPRYPATMHYRGEGVFMLSGRNVSRRRLFKPEML